MKTNQTVNIFTVDLEDWFCTRNIRGYGNLVWDDCYLRIEHSVAQLLELLNNFNVKATFFVLGYIADKVPHLIKSLKNEGHDIATHGYHHLQINKITPEEFEEDLARSLNSIENITGEKVIGFRAPVFSLTKDSIWALDILKNYGIRYDSSVFPGRWFNDYSFAHSENRFYMHENGILEIPLPCSEFLGLKIPFGGGAYFRHYPYALTRQLMNKFNSSGKVCTFYIHPWELDSEQPNFARGVINSYRRNHNIGKSSKRLNNLLSSFSFTSIESYLKGNGYLE